MMLHRVIASAGLALALASGSALAGAQDYRFEAAGKPQKSMDGKSLVAVRLVHLPDSKPVPGAILIQTRADMGPAGMGEMTAPVKAMGEAEPGIYRFEVQPGMAGTWALTLAAKVQGEPETVRGAVAVELAQ
jgi:hypothetical protein